MNKSLLTISFEFSLTHKHSTFTLVVKNALVPEVSASMTNTFVSSTVAPFAGAPLVPAPPVQEAVSPFQKIPRTSE